MSADLHSLLMQALAQRAGLDPATSPQELLAQMAGTDPTMGLLLQAMTQRSAEPEEPEPIEIDVAPAPLTPPRPAPSPELLRAVHGLQRKAQLMFHELEALRERNDLLAAALGACYLCWGEDPACTHCAGTGRPGAALPDRQLFAALVLPGVRRIRRLEQCERMAGRQSPVAARGDRQTDESEREDLE
jgi:hypothetical protein